MMVSSNVLGKREGQERGGLTQRITTASVKMDPMTWKPSLLSSLPIKSVERSSDAKGKTSAHQPIWRKFRVEIVSGGRNGKRDERTDVERKVSFAPSNPKRSAGDEHEPDLRGGRGRKKRAQSVSFAADVVSSSDVWRGETHPESPQQDS